MTPAPKPQKPCAFDLVAIAASAGGLNALMLANENHYGTVLSFYDTTLEHQLHGELETTNEDLEITNEEPHTRGVELDTYQNIMDAALGSVDIGIIIIDAKSSVTVWNKACQSLWGLSAEQTIGEPLLSLEFGLPVESLKRPINKILSGKEARLSVQLIGTERRGRRLSSQATLSALKMKDGTLNGAVILIDSTLLPEKEITPDGEAKARPTKRK